MNYSPPSRTDVTPRQTRGEPLTDAEFKRMRTLKAKGKTRTPLESEELGGLQARQYANPGGQR
jgi:hypothetical protein